MHLRNCYHGNPPSIERLSGGHSPLRKYTGADITNSTPGAVEELVTAMMRVDFGLSSYTGVPQGYLVPSVTRSLNYLHFVEDLLSEHGGCGAAVQEGDRRIRGLDVGVGASCVFPLLGCALHADWEFVGVDINPDAIEAARANSACFSDRIRLVLGDMMEEASSYDFVMCNPPFFSTALPQDESYRPFGGTQLERSFEGGEVQFVTRLIEQSSVKSNNSCCCCWFSSMLGKKESLTPVLAVLHAMRNNPVQSIRTYRLEQGHTFRWVVAWSFCRELGSANAVRGSELEVSNLNKEEEDDTLVRRVEAALASLKRYSRDTGLCSVEAGRFRVVVVVVGEGDGASRFRVDCLDVTAKGTEAEEEEEAWRCARSTQRHVEQAILRTSRKWRTTGGGGGTTSKRVKRR